MNDIVVFYHLFAVNNWRHILDHHIEQLQQSGLYGACKHIHVGVVYRERRDRTEVESVLRGNSKMTLYFARELGVGPVIWHNPEVRLADGRIAEAETILRMTEYAQQRDPDTSYLFLHSKGVTNPPSRQRRHFSFFVDRGFDPSGSERMAHDFILKDLDKVIHNWKEQVSVLGSVDFWYYIYNFFWVSGSLLHEFDFDEYVRLHEVLAPPQHRRFSLDRTSVAASAAHGNRHMFYLFPIKLYAFNNGIALTDPAYAYIDTRPSDGTVTIGWRQPLYPLVQLPADFREQNMKRIDSLLDR